VAKQVIPVLREAGLDQEEAARTLGASGWQTFTRITLPTIRWGLSYGVTLTTARALGEFGAVLVVSGNIIHRTQTATLHIHQEFTDFHYQGAFSASLVLAAVSFGMLLVMEYLKHRKKRDEMLR
ncbi:ABC transporter permease subunit, partial [bacterium]|nr:ABC transporter permease subunit [candidate division CSSED10-310 bacterium]